MEDKRKEILKEAKENPTLQILQMGEVTRELDADARLIRLYEWAGIFKIKKNKRGYRMFSYDEIVYIGELRKLIKVGYNTNLLYYLVDFLKTKKQDPVEFLTELSKHVNKIVKKRNKKDKE